VYFFLYTVSEGRDPVNVLVAAPHPDDDVIGCGGSMIRLRLAGHRVTIVYMTSGDAGGLTIGGEELARIREQEARQASGILGIDDLVFLRNPDGYLEPSRDNLMKLVQIIRHRKPDIAYIPHAREDHRDHKATHDLCAEAIRRAGSPWFREVGEEPWSVNAVLCYEVWTPLGDISFIEDITSSMPLKIEAIRSHRSQVDFIPYDEAAMSLNRFRGITTRKGKYCECFQVLFINRV
jgi:LmbE family N-acetylglucosaminyl deacetylase